MHHIQEKQITKIKIGNRYLIPYKDVLTFFGISRSTAWRLEKEGKIKFNRLGKKIIGVFEDELILMIE